MDLEKAEELAIFHMKKNGLESNWKFRFDGGRKRFGRCTESRKLASVLTPTYEATSGIISISKELTLINSCKRVLETILHETAHALVGVKHKHDHVWQAKCKELGTRETRYYSLANTVRTRKVPVV